MEGVRVYTVTNAKCYYCADLGYPSFENGGRQKGWLSRTLHESIELSTVIGGPLDKATDRSNEVEMTKLLLATISQEENFQDCQLKLQVKPQKLKNYQIKLQ